LLAQVSGWCSVFLLAILPSNVTKQLFLDFCLITLDVLQSGSRFIIEKKENGQNLMEA
jgi:hypothetical protein